ncbi:MAG: aspartate-semialdehyde dehydrogenase [Rhodovibrionaceae bacterium]
MAILSKQLHDFRLTTAEILYHLPDFPDLLQSYVWQDYDKAPQFPVLKRFLDFWEANLDGKLHSVQVATVPVITEGRSRYTDCHLTLH